VKKTAIDTIRKFDILTVFQCKREAVAIRHEQCMVARSSYSESEDNYILLMFFI